MIFNRKKKLEKWVQQYNSVANDIHECKLLIINAQRLQVEYITHYGHQQYTDFIEGCYEGIKVKETALSEAMLKVLYYDISNKTRLALTALAFCERLSRKRGTKFYIKSKYTFTKA